MPETCPVSADMIKLTRTASGSQDLCSCHNQQIYHNNNTNLKDMEKQCTFWSLLHLFAFFIFLLVLYHFMP